MGEFYNYRFFGGSVRWFLLGGFKIFTTWNVRLIAEFRGILNQGDLPDVLQSHCSWSYLRLYSLLMLKASVMFWWEPTHSFQSRAVVGICIWDVVPGQTTFIFLKLHFSQHISIFILFDVGSGFMKASLGNSWESLDTTDLPEGQAWMIWVPHPEKCSLHISPFPYFG